MTGQRVRKAVFPVGGLGTRFLPATKAMPKEMLPVMAKPLIQHVVEEARDSGIEEFIFVTGRNKTAIEDHFDHNFELETELARTGRHTALEAVGQFRPEPGQVAYLRQMKPLGLGHAVWCARNLIGDEPFAVLLADDLVLSSTPCLGQLIDVHEERGGSVVALMEVDRQRTSSYGIVTPGDDDGHTVEVAGLVEKPDPDRAPSNLAVVGRYVLSPAVFTSLERGERGAGGEIQLTDAIASQIGAEPLHGVRFKGTRYDCGTTVGFLEANVAYALQDPEIGASARSRIEALLGL